MGKERKIQEQLRAIVGTAPLATYAAKVTAVNGAECTVQRIADDMVIDEVKLNATCTDGRGIIISPAVGSIVLITSIDGVQWFVSMFDEIDSIIINGGQNNGLVNINDLTDKLNALVNAFNSHTHEVRVGGSAGTASQIVARATQFNASDYEDTKIKH
ncbi:MAG: hypothetical protein IKQ94_10735 [Bacteroidales bacterium]|nr:hypothetical protein [Bacteroidales bacterium]